MVLAWFSIPLQTFCKEWENVSATLKWKWKTSKNIPQKLCSWNDWKILRFIKTHRNLITNEVTSEGNWSRFNLNCWGKFFCYLRGFLNDFFLLCSPLHMKTQQYRSYKKDTFSKHNQNVPTKYLHHNTLSMNRLIVLIILNNSVCLCLCRFTTIQVQSTCTEHQNAMLLG